MKQIIIDFGTLHLMGSDFALRIYGYGLMLVLGFLVSIMLAQWRARRVGENPEILAQVGLLAVVGGILGARIAYGIQHWDQFSDHPAELFNITSGGLIYYGGVVLATFVVIGFLLLKRVPLRRYLDIVAVSMMVGLAFGRAGCLLNGCCWGGRASDNSYLGMCFPMYSTPLVKLDSSPGPFSAGTDFPSPVYAEQFKKHLVKPDPRLTILAQDPRIAEALAPVYGSREPLVTLLPPKYFHGQLSNDQAAMMFAPEEAVKKAFDQIKGPSGLVNEEAFRQAVQKARSGQGADGLLRGSEQWDEAVVFDEDRDGKLSLEEMRNYLRDRRQRLAARVTPFTAASAPSQDELAKRINDYLQADLFALARQEHSLPVKPSQALGIVNALIIALILAVFFRMRRREGQVFALMVVLYPITRFVEESIRDDNVHDILKGVFTHNQITSMILVAVGVVIWLFLMKTPASAGPTWGQRLAQVASTPGGQTPKKRN